MSEAIFLIILMIRLPPKSTLLPYTTLFRSRTVRRRGRGPGRRLRVARPDRRPQPHARPSPGRRLEMAKAPEGDQPTRRLRMEDRKSTRLNSSHANISYAVFCLNKTLELTLS